MAKSINISTFKIKVHLDSKQARSELARLQKSLQRFMKSSNKSFTGFNKGAAVATRRVNVLAKSVGRLNNKMKGTTAAGNGMTGMFRELAIGSFVAIGLYKVAGAFAEATKNGMEYQRAMMSVSASIAGSQWGQDQVKGLSSADKSTKLSDLGEQEKNFAAQLALKNGMDLTSTTSDYAKFFAAASANMGQESTRGMFESFAKLSVVYGLSAEQQKRATVAFTQMASKNQVMAEELKQQLGDVLPGSMDIFARALTKMGKYGTVTTKGLYDMMAAGTLVASEVLPFVAQEMNELADANNSYNKALNATPMLMSVMMGKAQAFGVGVYNQYSKMLGSMYIKLMGTLESSSAQIVTGTVLANFLNELNGVLDYVVKISNEFDVWFQQMDKIEQKEFTSNLSDFLMLVGGGLAAIIVAVAAIFIGWPVLLAAALVVMGSALIVWGTQLKDALYKSIANGLLALHQGFLDAKKWGNELAYNLFEPAFIYIDRLKAAFREFLDMGKAYVGNKIGAASNWLGEAGTSVSDTFGFGGANRPPMAASGGSTTTNGGTNYEDNRQQIFTIADPAQVEAVVEAATNDAYGQRTHSTTNR
jgi:tape measure domain-containing protein